LSIDDIIKNQLFGLFVKEECRCGNKGVGVEDQFLVINKPQIMLRFGSVQLSKSNMTNDKLVAMFVANRKAVNQNNK
jgi:hypothetical protein